MSPPQQEAARAPLFRQEALEHYRSYRAEGNVVRIAPEWARFTYWLVILAITSGALYCIFATVNEYASGTAVIRVDGRTELTSHLTGTVSKVLVHPGQRVHRGDPLVEFYLADEEAEFERVKKEYDGLMLRVLRDPGYQPARAGLNALAAQNDLARAKMAQRSVLAPNDGTTTDVRIRSGQAIHPGDVLMVVTTDEASARVVAMVPARYRPMLKSELPMRVELSGFRFAYQRLLVDSVGDEAIGPNEVKRFLGPDNADTVTVEGPVVLVQARLADMSFMAMGQTFRYYDGMVGTADVRVRRESILSALVPGIRDLFRSTGG